MQRIPCLLLLGALTLSAARSEVIYVDAGATGQGDGSTWTDAYTNLHTALAGASSGDQVWVAGGTYVAVDNVKVPTPFLVPTEVRLFGGFAGHESALADRPQPLVETILTADINGDDGPGFINRADNGREVVRIGDGGKGTLLDGLVITAAEKADGFNLGAGIRVNAGQLFLRNCRVHANRNLRGDALGAGLGIRNGFLVMEDCVFEDNHVQSATNDVSGGAGMFARDSFVLGTRCRFQANHVSTTNSQLGGGGLLVEYTGSIAGELVLRDCHFVENTSLGGASWGGGLGVVLFDGSGVNLLLEDCTLDRNQATGGGGFALQRRSHIGVLGETSIRLHRTDITNNTANLVGGVATLGGSVASEGIGTIELDGCLIKGNQSLYRDGAPADGSAGASLRARDISVRNTRFVGNIADDNGPPPSAGAAFYPEFSLVVEDSAFIGNRMVRNGGINRLEGSGAAFIVRSIASAAIRFRNTVIAGNRSSAWPGGYIQFGGNVILENVTIAGNRSDDGPPGLWSSLPMVMRNCAVAGSRKGPVGAPEIGAQLGGTRADFELYDCVLERIGMNLGLVERTIEADPQFADLLGPDGIIATGDESAALQPTSPCIDRGNNAWLPPDTLDLDNDGDTLEPIPFDVAGNPRRVDQRWRADTGLGQAPIVDIGAYEYPFTCPGDLDGDQTVDISDLAILLDAYGQGADQAGAEVDVQPNGRIDLSDLAALLTLFGNTCE